MSKGWIIAGVVVGGVVLYELVRPGGLGGVSAKPKTNVTSSGTVIAGLLTPLATLAANLTTPAGPRPIGPTAYGGGATPVYGQGYTADGLTLTAGSAADNVQITPGSED